MNAKTTTPASAPASAPAKAAKAGKPVPAPKAGKPAPKAGKPDAGTVKPNRKAPTPKPAPTNGAVKHIDALAAAAKVYVHDKERKTAGGHVSVDNGDALAQRLRGAALDAVYAEAAKVLETPEKELRAKYAHLNAGMQRMNLGNRIRANLNAK